MKIKIVPRICEGLRLTIPVREALEHEGNRVTETVTPNGLQYTVELRRPPAGIVLCLIGHRAEQHYGLRMVNEPEYPGEWPDGQGVAWHEWGEWVPCPKCGAALVWNEAGYVPGYRICLKGHHVQLSEDGRTAHVVLGRRGLLQPL